MRTHLGVLFVAVATAALLVASPLVHAATDGPETVTYAPLKQAPTPGILRAGAVRQHTLVIVPLYKAVLPDLEAMHKMGAATKKFWETEVPGLKLRIKYLKPARFAAACNRIITKAWEKSAALARIDPRTTGNHILTYAPECRMSGYASIRNGSGQIYIGMPDPEGGILAHEFGHNLGLTHADALHCTKGGTEVSLARSCREYEYLNWSDIMGNGPLVPGVRVGPMMQTLLTGRAQTLNPRTGGSVTLSATRKGLQAAVLNTPLGIIYFGVLTHPDAGQPALVLAEVATRNGSGLVRYPEVGYRTPEWHAALELGTFWDIPGTRLRAVITHANPNAATITVAPRPAAAAPAAPVTVTMPPNGQYPSQIPWTLSWTPSPSKDVTAYLVEVGDTVIARTNAGTTSVAMPASLLTTEVVDETTGDSRHVTTIIVDAVTRSGAHSPSAPITVLPVSPTLTLTSSLGDVEVPIPSGPFTLSWSITPLYAATVASWKIDYAGTSVSVPATQTSFEVDPALREDPDFGSVQIEALDAKGESIAWDSYSFYAGAWAGQ